MQGPPSPHHNTGNSLLVSLQYSFVATLACVTFKRMIVLHETKPLILSGIVDNHPFLPPPPNLKQYNDLNNVGVLWPQRGLVLILCQWAEWE